MQASENTPQNQLDQQASQSLPLLLSGDTGAAVRLLQKILIHLGYLNGGQWSGRLDSETTNAVRQFQRDNGLGVDGDVGDNTWRALTDQIRI